VTSAAVLIVDNHPAAAAYAHRIVTECGHAADIALGAPEAVDMAARKAYSLAIVSLDMRDGFALVAQLRAHDSRLAILAMTSSASVDTSLRALETGASVALVSPVSPTELRERTTRLLERRSAELKLERLRRDVDEHLRRTRR
jgi:two-component system, OmpR family, response regulator TctD